jgi:hypothetical protein
VIDVTKTLKLLPVAMVPLLDRLLRNQEIGTNLCETFVGGMGSLIIVKCSLVLAVLLQFPVSVVNPSHGLLQALPLELNLLLLKAETT